MFGELKPVSDGDPLPLTGSRLRVGRRSDCDIVLPYPGVSSHHCLMELDEGYWFVKDLNSRNGMKIDGTRIPPGARRRVNPRERIAFGKHEYVLDYEPSDLGAQGLPTSNR